MVSSLIFQKFSGEGLTEPPPQTPPPAFSRASPSVRASPSILGRFAPSTRASPSILGRFSGASRPRFGLRPQLLIEGLGLAPPQNKFLDPPLPPRKRKDQIFTRKRTAMNVFGFFQTVPRLRILL